jgi:hypothetical protein
MAFVDPFLLTLTLIMTILLIVANVYFVAYYAHASDKAFGSSTACKVIVVLNFLFASNLNSNIFYQIVAFIVAEC